MVGKARRSLSWITPAYAGKTALLNGYNDAIRDHPRIRGKDKEVKGMKKKIAGSPPHTRERHFCWLVPTFCGGITPAYAGKTQQAEFSSEDDRDHPRIRGKDSSDESSLDD